MTASESEDGEDRCGGDGPDDGYVARIGYGMYPLLLLTNPPALSPLSLFFFQGFIIFGGCHEFKWPVS